ncbi:MAG: fumarylacetoacetase [Hymenobacteraceae bacterium]|nr:fumarylacetoacetase [Hymenobacteraceae bacterium]
MLRSWIDLPADSDFSLANLPWGVFVAADRGPRTGVAIGEYVLDLYALSEFKFFEDLDLPTYKVFRRRTLNSFIMLGPAVWRAVRARVQELLRHDVADLRDHEEAMRTCLVRRADVRLLLPVKSRNYTDFYASREHATNVGSMFRPANPLLPNWVHVPIGYHGRASSIVVSGEAIRRPNGQRKAPDGASPTFGPSRQVDFELEMGMVIGVPTTLGATVPLAQAEAHIFGLALFNDWSARDIQAWEYQPLGPFLGKNFGSSLGAWIVPLEALEPFRTAGPAQDPAPLPYLHPAGPGAFDIQIEVAIQPAGGAETIVSRSNMKYLYWSLAQLLTHHASNGCNLEVGDLYATGTISGPTPGSLGSMLELAWRGTRPVPLADGTERRFLLDGDTVVLRAFAEKEGLRIGFGEVRGEILPAHGA